MSEEEKPKKESDKKKLVDDQNKLILKLGDDDSALVVRTNGEIELVSRDIQGKEDNYLGDLEDLNKTFTLVLAFAAALENELMMAEYNAKSGAALVKLVNEQGVKLRKFNDDIYDSFGEAAEEVFSEVRAHSNLAGRIHASFLRAREELGAWAKISDQAYVEQRNRVLGL